MKSRFIKVLKKIIYAVSELLHILKGVFLAITRKCSDKSFECRCKSDGSEEESEA